VEEIKSKAQGEDLVTIMQNTDILEDERESVMMMSQDIDGNKLGKDAEDAKKHFSNKRGGANLDVTAIKRILASFHPGLPAYSNIEEIMDSVEMSLVLKFKLLYLRDHEV
jgi:hypothetical protein